MASKNDTMWYWEYVVKVWNSCDEKAEIRSGIITGYTMKDAVEVLDEYYGEEIEEIQMLKAICDIAFEFEYVEEDTDFDFTIKRKDKE